MKVNIESLASFGVAITPYDKNSKIEDLNFLELKELFSSHQLLLLRGFRPLKNKDELCHFSEKWGEICLWPFGKVLELVKSEDPVDHIFDSSCVPMHWDGMYRTHIPEYQVFQCVKAPLANQGGRTSFFHTPLALSNSSSTTRALWARAIGTYTRTTEVYQSRTISPVITKHPYKDGPVIRYNEPPPSVESGFINPHDHFFSGVETHEISDLHASLKRALYSEACSYFHEWQTGDIVIADNFTLLHGREAFTDHSPRHLRRVQVHSHLPFENPSLESL